MTRRKAIVIGSGIGGIACAIRLQSLGFDSVLLEKLDAPGGRAYVRRAEGFTFDMGPTVLTVPHFIEELFPSSAARRGSTSPTSRPTSSADSASRAASAAESTPAATSRFARSCRFTGSISMTAPSSITTPTRRTYARRSRASRPRISRGTSASTRRRARSSSAGFLELGYTYFGNLQSMVSVVPDLLKLGAIQPLFSLIKKYFKSDKMRQVFSFEPLLIGGNPLKVPAIYAMIHFVEKTWGVHFAMGERGRSSPR